MSDDEDKFKKILGCSACCLIFIIILIATSFGVIEPTEWGLKYNSLGKKITSNTSILTLFFVNMIHS
jgi:hypothetical protein